MMRSLQDDSWGHQQLQSVRLQLAHCRPEGMCVSEAVPLDSSSSHVQQGLTWSPFGTNAEFATASLTAEHAACFSLWLRPDGVHCLPVSSQMDRTSMRVSGCDMQEAEPEVTKHIEGLGITPLQLALPWMLNAFADQLPVDQLLLLWDRIIAQDSLLPLPVLAIAVFVFRREVSLCPFP